MSKNNYNNDIYEMYEEECNKNILLSKENWNLRLENSNLKYELQYKKESFDNKIKSEVESSTTPLITENNILHNELEKAYKEIERLKKELNNKDYNIDKLQCFVNKDSYNSGIPTSKEINTKHSKTNTYNHRQKSHTKTGGQFGHKGKTLTKEKLLNKIRKNNIKVKKVIHYIKESKNQKDVIKYKIGINIEPYVEKHIFKHTKNSENILPKEFYSEVTYHENIKSLITILGNYYSLPYNKIKEFIFDITQGLINISEGTIDNIYNEFDNKTLDTLNNITTNLMNSSYQHTDETTTKENGKEVYYRGYANPLNVLYKYHQHKGHKPILEDGILDNFIGTIISDHDTAIFKYGTNNQDCIIHIGRYCKEAQANICNTSWQMKLYHLLLKFEKNRKILSGFGRNKFTNEEIVKMEKEYDDILIIAKEQNNNITSSYWKDKANALLKRLIRYKNSVLFYIHDFDIPYDNNFMERALRMIKGKTKVSGGFRSSNGAIRFGNIMSIIKTAKLRKINPFSCIRQIYEGKALFA